MMPEIDAWRGSDTILDESVCPICFSEICEGHDDDAREGHSAPSISPTFTSASQGLPEDGLTDAVDVAAEGRAIAAAGIRYVVNGLIPSYGMLGMSVAYAKVGKTTFAHALGAAVGSGRPFIDRDVQQARVLDVASEDPLEYTAYLARDLQVPRGAMTFFRRPIQLDPDGLARICETVKAGGYGLVLISSWQSVVSGLIRDENDNAGSVAVLERVKLAARGTGVPWVIDAHSGKGEDQSDGADPTRAMRGASAAAGAADFMLSLRYADGSFSSRRRLSGKGRFVSFEPMLIDFDAKSSTYTAIGDTKTAAESTWQRIETSGVLRDWAGLHAIATAIGQVTDPGRMSGHTRKQLNNALRNRDGVDSRTVTRRGQKTSLYRLAGGTK